MCVAMHRVGCMGRIVSKVNSVCVSLVCVLFYWKTNGPQKGT